MKRDSENHCCFCDKWPADEVTIEHFRPKSVFPNEAFDWANLYACCPRCGNMKGAQFDEALLRPDEVGYSFNRYFEIGIEGKLVPSPAATAEEQHRAQVTIDLYRLNRDDLRDHRAELQRSTDPPQIMFRFMW